MVFCVCICLCTVLQSGLPITIIFVCFFSVMSAQVASEIECTFTFITFTASHVSLKFPIFDNLKSH